MPMTFLSHQAVVLPLKMAAPNRTSGTALVLGSMAPDVEYYLRTYPTTTISHTWMGQLTFCLPVTLALFWIVTRVVAEPLAAHLPDGGDLRLSEYALLREQPNTVRHWAVVGASALTGSISHLVLDRLSGAWSNRAGGDSTSWIPPEMLPSPEAWVLVKLSTWILLAAVSVVLMRRIGRRRLLRAWVTERWRSVRTSGAERRTQHTTQGDAAGAGRPRDGGVAHEHAPSYAWPAAFWTPILVAAMTGGVLGAVYRRSGFHLHDPATWVHIALCAISGAFIGLIVASLAWHRRMKRLIQTRGTQA